MNIERILKLADYIEYHPEKFDMMHWMSGSLIYKDVKAGELYNTCGTSACIAGHAVAMFRPEIDMNMWFSFEEKGGLILGLDVETALTLFAPLRSKQGIGIHEVTNLHATKCLRHLATTGEVDWVSTKPTRFEVLKNRAICYMLDFFR